MPSKCVLVQVLLVLNLYLLYQHCDLYAFVGAPHGYAVKMGALALNDNSVARFSPSHILDNKIRLSCKHLLFRVGCEETDGLATRGFPAKNSVRSVLENNTFTMSMINRKTAARNLDRQLLGLTPHFLAPSRYGSGLE